MSDFRPLWGVGRLMANAILNFHFDYLNTSLSWNNFVLKHFFLFFSHPKECPRSKQSDV